MDDVPSEILIHFFKCLLRHDRHTFTAVLRVCRAWYELGLPILWKDICLHGRLFARGFYAAVVNISKISKLSRGAEIGIGCTGSSLVRSLTISAGNLPGLGRTEKALHVAKHFTAYETIIQTQRGWSDITMHEVLGALTGVKSLSLRLESWTAGATVNFLTAIHYFHDLESLEVEHWETFRHLPHVDAYKPCQRDGSDNHLCPRLNSCLPRVKHLRLRLPALCEDILVSDGWPPDGLKRLETFSISLLTNSLEPDTETSGAQIGQRIRQLLVSTPGIPNLTSCKVVSLLWDKEKHSKWNVGDRRSFPGYVIRDVLANTTTVWPVIEIDRFKRGREGDEDFFMRRTEQLPFPRPPATTATSSETFTGNDAAHNSNKESSRVDQWMQGHTYVDQFARDSTELSFLTDAGSWIEDVDLGFRFPAAFTETFRSKTSDYIWKPIPVLSRTSNGDYRRNEMHKLLFKWEEMADGKALLVPKTFQGLDEVHEIRREKAPKEIEENLEVSDFSASDVDEDDEEEAFVEERFFSGTEDN